MTEQGTTKFILLFEGRTGSSLLGGLLNQHPRISFLGEDVAALLGEGWEAQEAWMRSLFFDTANFADRRLKAGIASVGFKVKLRETASPEGLKAFIEAHGIKVIYMRRENIVKQVVSSIRAIDLHQNTGNFNLFVGQDELVPAGYRIEPDRFDTILRWIEDCEGRLGALVKGLDAPVLEVTYEDLVGDTDGTLARIFDYVGAGGYGGAVVKQLLKVTSDKLDEAVPNLQELKRHYVNTRYEAMFE